MSIREFTGTAEITDHGIKKHFTKWEKEPLQSVIELIANGFDAGASKVEVSIESNNMHGLASVTVLDNGSGIDIDNCKMHFSRFNESQKQGNDDLQGTHGKGRLSFHLLCNEATWYTKANNLNAKISIESSSLRIFKAEEIEPNRQHALLSELKSGTCVSLKNFNCNLPNDTEIINRLQNNFGWRLALNHSRKLILNGNEIEIPENKTFYKSIEIDDVSVNVSLIQWLSKPGQEKSYNYVVNSDGRIVYRELSSFNKKTNFFLSSYSRSDWLNNFDRHDSSLNFNDENQAKPSSPAYKKLKKEIYLFSQEIYENFLREYVKEKIQEYDDLGYFPLNSRLSYSEAEWRKSNTKSFVQDLYFTDPSIFTSLKPKPTKVLIALIDKILVSNENDSLFDILEGILNLDEINVKKLSKQVKHSSLENIVSTIEILQKREFAVHKLKEIMVKHYKTVLETPDLQTIIENNTWLFGNKYTLLGAEEDDFQKIAYNLRDEIKGIKSLDDDDFDDYDLADGLTVKGVRRQVDLFLARKNIAFNSRNESYYQCTIIEIKRPGVALNEKHLKQIKDYAKIISQHSGYSLEKMRFEIILVGRKISDADFEIESALETAEAKNEPGLVFSLKNERIKGYVKTWGTIFAEFELANDYLLNQLQTRRDSLDSKSSTELISEFQVPIV